ncbi:MAG: sodium:calcium antiporter [Planctomycetota bacterium]
MSDHTSKTSSLLKPLLICALAAAPALYLQIAGIHAHAGIEAAFYGSAILSAAFVLTWASEAAQMDVPRAFAVVVLSLIAVLPEYAIDILIAWRAAHEPSQRELAIANMTGANRLLVGVAWPMIWLLTAWKLGRPKVRTPRELGLEVVLLILSSLLVTVMALTGKLSILYGCILASVFFFYAFLSIRSEAGEPHGVGPAAAIMAMSKNPRRITVITLLVLAATVICVVAHPFKDALEHTSKAIGISEYVVIQWVAPLASEAPEVVVAILLVFEKRPTEALAVLVASKVNQFTLLVGCIPFAYGWSAGDGRSMPLDHHQIAEVSVTGAQTLFAAATIANRTLGVKGGLSLFSLFLLQLGVSFTIEMQAPGENKAHWETLSRWIFAGVYTAVALGLFIYQFHKFRAMLVMAMKRIKFAFTFGG